MHSEHQPTYSSIIGPEDYNRLMTEQHLYIAEADACVSRLLRGIHDTRRIIEAVELGCGPARLLQHVAQDMNVHATGIDHDNEFIRYGRRILRQQGIPATIHKADIAVYRHPVPVDVFYSQGVHHHIEKGTKTLAYLRNVHDQLKPDGSFIVSDEFLPEYSTPKERKIRTIIWYSHIIANAITGGYKQLAEEEAKTLLDDLNEHGNQNGLKSKAQIGTVLRNVDLINKLACNKKMKEGARRANLLLGSISSMRNTEKSGNPSMDLSRGDYKISDSVFRKEIDEAGFFVDQIHTIGPVENIGGFSVYLLRKS